MSKYYMHLLDGQPAFFSEPDQAVCFMASSGPCLYNFLATTLDQIYQEQRISAQTRKMDIHRFKYGYVLVRTPEKSNV